MIDVQFNAVSRSTPCGMGKIWRTPGYSVYQMSLW